LGAELGNIWRAADRIGGPHAALVKLLILTGQRRGEVGGMTWGEFNMDAKLWRLPKERTKNGKPHDVPLSKPALEILGRLPRLGNFVITFTGTAPVNSFAKTKARLDALLPLGTPAWRLHDLRRTVASGLAQLGVNLPVIEKVLNHSSGSFAGIVGVYQHHSFTDEKRLALDAWAAHVMALTAGE
jgi:integrase